MSENLEQTVTQEQIVTATPEVSQVVAESLWGTPSVYQNVETQPTQESQQPAQQETIAPSASEVQTQTADSDVIGLDDFFQQEFGMNHTDFKSKWEEYNKPKEIVPTPETQWANDESKRLFDAFREGKEDDVYNYLNQKKQLERLEKYEIADANQAAEIIRTNLQFKYKDLSGPEIDRLFARQYSIPPEPQQTELQSDEEYAAIVAQWKQQVQEKQQDMIIDAKLAKPELAQFKSQIVLPEIQKPQPQDAGPTPEELAAFETARRGYLDALTSNYQNFKSFNVTAKNGEVELPISYNISSEEQVASKQELEEFSVSQFFDKRWWDDKGNPNVTLMQEDLYLLRNRDKILQKIANETAAKMYDHYVQKQNNINLKGVNPELGPNSPSQLAPKNESQSVAERIWAM